MKKQVTLTIDFERMTIPSTYLKDVRKALTLRLRTPASLDNGTLCVNTREDPLYWSAEGSLQTSPGLLHRVQTALEHAGYRVAVHDMRRYSRKFLPVGEATAETTRQEREMLTCATAAFGGQLLLRRSHREAIVRLHGHFADTRTLVVTNTAEDAGQLRKKLESVLLEPVQIPSGARQTRARLCVVHGRRFAEGVNFTSDMDWGLILFLGVEAATSVHSLGNWQHPLFARRFVLHHRRNLSFNERLLLELVAGPPIYRQPAYCESVPQVAVETIMATTLTESPAANPLERKRRFLWYNARRNRLIADVAKAYAAADPRRLQNLQVALDADPGTWATYGEGLDTVIVVESVAHAQAMSKLLPGWKLRTDEARNELVGERRLGSWESYGQSRAIVTFAWLQKNGLAAEVVIRADGTATAWNEQWGAHPDIARQDRIMRLIDVQDDFDHAACKDSAARLRNYEQYGWHQACAANA